VICPISNETSLQNTWGETGVIVSAGILGLTDVDALVVSMAKDSSRLSPEE
jgi:hypothetical protein